MRNDSKRVPGKNWRPLGGKPLFCHVVASLQACGWVDQIVIDTDSDVIRTIARREFPSATLIDRPEHLRDDRLPMNDVLLNTTSRVEADFYLQTHSTNPLLKPDTIAAAIEQFVEANGTYDSLFGVTRLQQRLWDQLTRPVNHNPAILLRTQDLPPVYAENSCMYLFSRQSLANHHNRIGARPLMFEIDRVEAWDIDEETDFVIAEMLHAAIQQSQRSAA
jgi:CMP-N-acetylneuraminic acid synthetase